MTAALETIGIAASGYGIADYPAGTTFGPRLCQDFEFVWILAGQATWHCGESDIPLEPGDLVCCQPGMRDGFTWDLERTTRHGFIHFHLEEEPDPPVADWPLHRHCRSGGILTPLLRHAQYLIGPDGEPAQLRTCLRLLLQAFTAGRAGTVDDTAGPHDHPLIAGIVDELHRAWQHDGPLRPPTTDELAARLGVSRAHLCRISRKQLDVTPQELIRLLRLDRAATLLARGNLSVQAIAEYCGFESPFHFSRRFKRVYGYSPRQFRDHVTEGLMRPTIDLVHIRRIADKLASDS